MPPFVRCSAYPARRQAAALNPPSIDPWAAGFRFGEGALAFGNLWLVALWQVSTDTFEAEVRFTRAVM